MTTTGNHLEVELGNFLNGMKSNPGLDAALAARLALYTFQVTYINRAPTDAEINQFGVHDFPIYLLTATGLFTTSKDEIFKLLIKHRIPEGTQVMERIDPNTTSHIGVKTYEIFEKHWEEHPSILGFGVPGTYFMPNSQTRCRKIGIMKVSETMKENVHFSMWPTKLISVIKHEVGHMLALTHEDGTIMAASYDVNFNFPRFTNDQLRVVADALDALTQN